MHGNAKSVSEHTRVYYSNTDRDSLCVIPIGSGTSY